MITFASSALVIPRLIGLDVLWDPWVGGVLSLSSCARVCVVRPVRAGLHASKGFNTKFPPALLKGVSTHYADGLDYYA